MSAQTRFIHVGNVKIRIHESAPKSEDSRPAVVFFHGHSFSIDDWIEIGTLKLVTEHGFHVLAVDLPRGKTTKSDTMDLKEISDYNPFFEQLLSQIGIPEDKKLVIVGPSMGGAFALSYASAHPERVSGLVLIAPALYGLERQIADLKEIPTLLVWGEKDEVFPLDEFARALQNLLPKAKLVVLKGASHAAYLDRPKEFHKYLLNFLEETGSI